MLSRTADHLFWMARYTERAENTARMLDVNYQMAMMPQSAEVAEQGWRAMLDISELTDEFDAKHILLSSRDVLEFMVKDMNNVSSIMSCLRAARENARAVRGSLTTEVWETINTTWLEVQKIIADGMLEKDPAQFFEWVKFRSHLSRGVQMGTMLKDDSFHFLRLGTFLERADNTARILHVKFQGSGQFDGASTTEVSDYYHWAAILRSVSGFEVYRKVYRDVITPERVAELLILRSDMPRSLLASLDEVVGILGCVKNQQSNETQRRAGKLQSNLQYGRIEDILAVGLEAYLTNFLERINELGNGISKDFLVPLAVA